MKMTTRKNLLLAAVLLASSAQAQERYMTRTGNVSFRSETPMETIEGVNSKVTSVWDITTGAVEFSMLIKGFAFEKALMQEHFNENYMESNTFPKSSFKGKIGGITADQVRKAGTYPVEVSGDLTIHGITKPVKTKGTITVGADGTIQAVSDFQVKPEDYGMKIPGAVRDKIAAAMEVKVRMDYQKM